MVSNSSVKVVNMARWTSKKKSEAVLSILKGKTTLVDFCRKNDLKQREVEKWIKEFIEGGQRALLTNPRSKKDALEHENENLKHVIGEQALQIRVLKKSIEIAERDENES